MTTSAPAPADARTSTGGSKTESVPLPEWPPHSRNREATRHRRLSTAAALPIFSTVSTCGQTFPATQSEIVRVLSFVSLHPDIALGTLKRALDG